MKRQFTWYVLLFAQCWAISLVQAQDNPVVLDDLVLVIEQPFNREEVWSAMQQFHTNTQVGIAITMVYQDDAYTASARKSQANWLKRELGISLFITLDEDKAYQQCVMQVTPAVEMLLPLEDRQQIQKELMEHYFFSDLTADDACTQGLLVGIAAMQENILENKNKAGASEELVAEVLNYLHKKVSIWIDDNSNSLPSCVPEREEGLILILEQADRYLEKPADLLDVFSAEDLIQIEQYVAKRRASAKESYQSALTETEWNELVCSVFSYLSDITEGQGDVANVRNKALNALIEGFRTASLQKKASFSVSLDYIHNETDQSYFIPGIAGLRVSVTDVRSSVPYPFEEAVSTEYFFKDVSGESEVAGISFRDQAVFQLYADKWVSSDAPKFLLHTYRNVKVARGLDSQTLLIDYLSGRYDYENVQAMVNKIIASHQQGSEALNLDGLLSSKEVYARNVDFGDKGIYNLYIQRSGNLSEDVSSFYNYTKTPVTKVMGFSGDFIEYRVSNRSGGSTTITLPSSEARNFEKKVLKLHSAKSGKWYLDMLTEMRTANLNGDSQVDLTAFGRDGGLSPVFKVKHEGQKLKLMVVKPLLSKEMTNKVDPTIRPKPVIGTVDNALDKAYKWQKYGFVNTTGKGSFHNTNLYVSTAQTELFESYMFLQQEVLQEVLLSGIQWKSQFDNYFSSYTCFSPKNQCCYQAVKTIIEQFGVTTDRSKSMDVAELTTPTNYKTVKATSDFEKGLEYLKSTIKPNEQGGKPVVVGVHYEKEGKSYNTNNATRHFVVIVGKGYNKILGKEYYRFYEVGFSDLGKAIDQENKLYVEPSQRKIIGQSNGKTYTVTEIRKNY